MAQYSAQELPNVVRRTQRKTMSMATDLTDHLKDTPHAARSLHVFLQEMAFNQQYVEDLCYEAHRRERTIRTHQHYESCKDRQIRDLQYQNQILMDLLRANNIDVPFGYATTVPTYAQDGGANQEGTRHDQSDIRSSVGGSPD